MMIAEGQVLHGRYYIDSLIGQGGMSYVYRALDQKMGRTVAIKVLKAEYCEDAEFIKKFQNEAQAAAKLNHPNIVAAYDVVDEDKLHFIVMEMVEGITLKNYIQRKGRLDNKETVGIALQVIDGIAQAHRMGIVHRDIKPQNMIVGEDGVVKVADFGIARAATQQTVNATVMGSVHYISPEQARSGISDERSDIYSFGCTLFEMLTGKVPFDGENSVAVVLSHIETPMPHVRSLVPSVYPALDAAVWKCTQKKADRRYQHIEELAEDLRQALVDPKGDFVNLEGCDQEELGETRILSPYEIDQIKQKSKNKADRLIEDLFVDEAMDNEEISEKMSRIYKFIAIGCVAIILVLAAMIGGNLLGLLHFGTDRETAVVVAAAAEETETTESSPINITISAIETRIQEIIGKPATEAEEFLAGYDLKMRTVGAAFSDNYPEPGVVISYPSEQYKPGDIVDVTISKGAETLDFSDETALQEMSYESLEEELKARGITPEVEEVYSDTVPAGNIISSSKTSTAGSEPLKLTVSKGSAPVLVPDVRNMTETEAKARLETAGLSLGTVTTTASQDVAAGLVVSQQYASGSSIGRGTSVNLVLSGGEDGTETSAAETQTTAVSSTRETTEKWYSNISESCVVGQGGPGASGTVLVSIRLRQYVDNAYRYTILQPARSYASGTEIQVVFGNIEGAPGVETGVVEVVDASTDTVIQSFGCKFGP